MDKESKIAAESPSPPLIVTLNGKFYDISEFVPKHPGGSKVLRKVAGSEVSTFMSGNERVLGAKHEHSKAAYDILERYSLDGAFKNDLIETENLTLWKVGKLEDKYWQWIHRPFDGSIRLFESDILENLTRSKWWMIPIVWMPVVLFYFFDGLFNFIDNYGYFRGQILSISLFAIGVLAWTLLEYGLHRGVFHWKPNPKSYNQITFHFLLHGLHHKTPMDKDRLVFPPAAAAILVSIFYVSYRSILPYPVFCCFATGKLFGYICYDMIHYYLHHGMPEINSMMHHKKVYHHNHHFKDTDAGFGISTVLWDKVFGTGGIGPNL